MSPEDVRNHCDQLTYIKNVKDLIISDARALYSVQGYTSHKSTFDVITSTYGGGYQATLIVYPDLTTDTRFMTLYEGLRCRDLCGAVKMLWDGLQTTLGSMKALHAQQVAVRPATTRSGTTTLSPEMTTTSAASETPSPSIKTPSSAEQNV